MEENRTLRIFIICAVVVLCLALVALAAVVIYRQAEQSRINNAYETETQELRAEKANLLSKYNRLVDEYVDAVGIKGSLSFAFIDLDTVLYDVVYPMLSEEEGSIAGILCFSPGNLPGMEGKITSEQYGELVSVGWGNALYFETDKDEDGNEIPLDTWLYEMRTSLGNAGIAMPNTVVFGSDFEYEAELDGLLLENGITHAVQYDSDDFPLIETTAEDGVWHPGACGWLTSGVSSVMFNEVKRNGGHFVFTVAFNRPKDVYENYDPQNVDVVDQFEKMLVTIKTSCIDGEFTVYSDLDEAKEYRAVYNAGVEVAKAEAEADRALLQEQINDVDRQLLAVYNKYYG